ncbi:MAG: TIGR00269 family protein [Mailhella sp.]|nr:TIGR00269 family protein [Mailhella sp.]
MKCSRCRRTAVVNLPSHNAAFCRDCFLDFFLKQVRRGIEQYGLIREHDRVLAALSGGKDSLTLALALHELGIGVTALHIDLGIGPSSQKARAVCERFCKEHGIPLMIKETAEDGLAIPLVKEALNRPICSACGKIKRYYFNKIAMDGGFASIATGHNLDDEVARLSSNTLRWDKGYLSDQGPLLEGNGGFARKIKPLWRLTEYETAHYAFLMGIENHYAPCPYSEGASFSVLKKLWLDLEEVMPGRKISFYQGFLERGRPLFAADETENGDVLRPCASCGYPTSADICGVCRIRRAVQEKAAGAAGKN